MRVKTLQVVWHEKEPVCSVDFSRSGILATGGADKTIKVVLDQDGNPAVRFLANHRGLNHAVNVVRFSPCGELMASGGDGGEVVLWKQPDSATATSAPRGNLNGGEDEEGVEGIKWKMTASLRGHRDDVMDLCWSPDASGLMTGSVENICLLWDVEGRKEQLRLQHHAHLVQGVAWDPLGHYVVSQSSDRTCKVYCQRPSAAGCATAGRKGSSAAAAVAAASTSCAISIKDFMLQATLSKRTMAADADTTAQPAGQPPQQQQGGTPQPRTAGQPAQTRHSLFHDENMANTFYRRLSWSPDGNFLAVPAGMFKADTTAANINATYIFARGDWSSPLVVLPSGQKIAAAVRFCPVLFKPKRNQPNSGNAERDVATPEPVAVADGLPQLPYRMVLAVATKDSVLLYETETFSLLGVLGGLHLAAITDLAWSPDAAMLAVASRDGFCSLAAFQPGELGKPFPQKGVQPEAAASEDQLPPVAAAAASFAAATRRMAERAAVAAAAALAAAAAPDAAAAAVAAPPPAVGSSSPPTAAVVLSPANASQIRQPKRIVPTQVIAAAAAAAPSLQQQASPPSATRTHQLPAPGPKRIVPQPIAAGPPAAAAAVPPTAAAAAAVPLASSSGAAVPAAAAAKPNRRIAPIPVGSTATAGVQTKPSIGATAGADAAPQSATCIFVGAAGTTAEPEPSQPGSAAGEAAAAATAHAALPQVEAADADRCPLRPMMSPGQQQVPAMSPSSSSKPQRRITPIPIQSVSPSAVAAASGSSSAASAAAAAPVPAATDKENRQQGGEGPGELPIQPKPRFSIAAMAAKAGAAAAAAASGVKRTAAQSVEQAAGPCDSSLHKRPCQ